MASTFRTGLNSALCVAAIASLHLHTDAAAQTGLTSERARALIQAHADKGHITLLNGAHDGSWLMERPVVGIVSSENCMTDFAAPQTTQLKGVKSAANHYLVYWNALSDIRVEGIRISFNAPAVGMANYAYFVVADGAARTDVLRAVQTLVRNCGGNPASVSGAQPLPLFPRSLDAGEPVTDTTSMRSVAPD